MYVAHPEGGADGNKRNEAKIQACAGKLLACTQLCPPLVLVEENVKAPEFLLPSTRVPCSACVEKTKKSVNVDVYRTMGKFTLK